MLDEHSPVLGTRGLDVRQGELAGLADRASMKGLILAMDRHGVNWRTWHDSPVWE